MRDSLKESLGNAGVETIIHNLIPPHKQPALYEYNHLKLSIIELIYNQILSLPCKLRLSIKDQEFIIKACKDF